MLVAIGRVALLVCVRVDEEPRPTLCGATLQFLRDGNGGGGVAALPHIAQVLHAVWKRAGPVVGAKAAVLELLEPGQHARGHSARELVALQQAATRGSHKAREQGKAMALWAAGRAATAHNACISVARTTRSGMGPDILLYSTLLHQAAVSRWRACLCVGGCARDTHRVLRLRSGAKGGFFSGPKNELGMGPVSWLYWKNMYCSVGHGYVLLAMAAGKGPVSLLLLRLRAGQARRLALARAIHCGTWRPLRPTSGVGGVAGRPGCSESGRRQRWRINQAASAAPGW